MKQIFFLSFLLFLCVGLVPPVSAMEIYKWIDEEGRVHYGDRSPETESEQIQIKPPATEENASDRPDSEGRQRKRKRLLRAYEKERRERQAQRQEEKRRSEVREKNCTTARENLRKMRQASYLYETDETGERKILSDTQRRRVTDRWEAEVERWCD